MQSSFQSTGYNHALQTQILGPSGLKIFAGEDLSKFIVMQLAVTEEECNKFSRIFGGDNSKSKNKEEIK